MDDKSRHFVETTSEKITDFAFTFTLQRESLLKAKNSFNDRIPLVILRDGVRRFKRKKGAHFLTIARRSDRSLNNGATK